MRGKIVINTWDLKVREGQIVQQNQWEEVMASKAKLIMTNMADAISAPLSDSKMFINYISCGNYKSLQTPMIQALIQNQFAGKNLRRWRATLEENSVPHPYRIGIIFMDFPG